MKKTNRMKKCSVGIQSRELHAIGTNAISPNASNGAMSVLTRQKCDSHSSTNFEE